MKSFAPPGRIGQATHAEERETDPEPSFGPGQRRVGLDEEIEDPRQHRRVDADAGVADAHDRRVPIALGGDSNLATGPGVFGGIAQEVAEYLLQPLRVAMQNYRVVFDGRAVRKDTEVLASGSMANPISDCIPSPQNDEITPVMVGRRAPRQSWK